MQALPSTVPPPLALSRASFKEWLLVCEAMGRGETSLLIRKGGIAEGRDGFSFKFPAFWLFPTFFHEQAAKLRGQFADWQPQEDSTRDHVMITQGAEVLWTATVRDELALSQISHYHLWTDEVVAERFAYDEEPGVHLAFVRVWNLETPVILDWQRSFGGCRSWITLPDSFEPGAMNPARPESELQEESTELRAILKLA